jgi:hypothetical protein
LTFIELFQVLANILRIVIFEKIWLLDELKTGNRLIFFYFSFQPKLSVRGEDASTLVAKIGANFSILIMKGIVLNLQLEFKAILYRLKASFLIHNQKVLENDDSFFQTAFK